VQRPSEINGHRSRLLSLRAHKPPELDELPSDSLFVAKPYTAERMIAVVSELQ
jgi:hypothetical protein